jgi:outer membrane lipoprotein-sorting protein
MRRVLVLVALAAVFSAGCSGVDAQKAQTILDQSTTAMADVKSVSFAMRMWTSGGPDGTDFTVLMHGGGYEKGKRAERPTSRSARATSPGWAR